MLTRRGLQTPVAVAGGAGLGASLVLIHIYVAPIKRFLQALWALGFSGGLFLAATQARSPLPDGTGVQGTAAVLYQAGSCCSLAAKLTVILARRTKSSQWAV